MRAVGRVIPDFSSDLADETELVPPRKSKAEAQARPSIGARRRKDMGTNDVGTVRFFMFFWRIQTNVGS